MIENDDIQVTAQKIAAELLATHSAPNYESLAECIQGFLGCIADNTFRGNHHFVAILEAIVQILCETLEPEQVIL